MKPTYRNFLKTGIALGPLGLEQCADAPAYFCTPKGAKIIGWAGVDGIHYCFVRGFGEMVFAVSPMNPAPEYVHPLARDFSDFLQLLLACGDCGALEQAWQWSEEQFAAFLTQNPPTDAQKNLLNQIAQQTGLSPMENPWQYLRALQSSFDASKLPYTEDFYAPEMNPDAPQQPPEWKVTFSGGFSPARGERAGRELALGGEFVWAGRQWRVPSVYLCGKGLVVDFCMRIEAQAILDFAKKWNIDLKTGDAPSLSSDEQMQMEAENPLRCSFSPKVQMNRKELIYSHGFGTVWNPCLPPACADQSSGKQALDHYGLDPAAGWMFWRCCYPWATRRTPVIRSLSVTMVQDACLRPGPHFVVSRPGDRFVFDYAGRQHTLTVLEYEAQTMDWNRMPDREGLEYPSHYTAMTYTIDPALPDGLLHVTDCCEGDRPRYAPSAPGQPEASGCAVVVGIIGGADGPTSFLVSPAEQPRQLAACSSLHFAPANKVEWRLEFSEKAFADATFALLAP